MGGAHFCDFYLQELYQVLMVRIKEKIPSGFRQGKGSCSENMSESFVLYNKACPQEKVLYQNLTHSVLSEPNQLEERKLATSSSRQPFHATQLGKQI